MYLYPIALTQQFRFCGNPFRIDLYKGCRFECSYCFANARVSKFQRGFDVADFTIVEKLFSKAFDNNKESRNLNVELLRHRVPLHVGGLCDPFIPEEFEYKLTLKLLKLSNKYNYPLVISTKQAAFLPEYYEAFNPELHAFQISLMSANTDFIRKYEDFTPTAEARIDFIRFLHKCGYWVGLRVQPLIDLNEALYLIKKVQDSVNYITVEHLKISNENVEFKKRYEEDRGNTMYRRARKIMRSLEVVTAIKAHNLKKILEIATVPVGAGDNDLHQKSQSRCCCGIDTMGKNFDGWMKYNYTYFITGEVTDEEKESLWYPKCNVDSCLNNQSRYSYKDTVRGDCNNVKHYTDEYIKRIGGKDSQTYTNVLFTNLGGNK